MAFAFSSWDNNLSVWMERDGERGLEKRREGDRNVLTFIKFWPPFRLLPFPLPPFLSIPLHSKYMVVQKN